MHMPKKTFFSLLDRVQKDFSTIRGSQDICGPIFFGKLAQNGPNGAKIDKNWQKLGKIRKIRENLQKFAKIRKN